MFANLHGADAVAGVTIFKRAHLTLIMSALGIDDGWETGHFALSSGEQK